MTVHGVGWTFVTISLLARSLCARVCVCPLVVSIFSKVGGWGLDLDIFQVLVRFLALLRIFVDVFWLRYTTGYSSEEQWSKFEF